MIYEREVYEKWFRDAIQARCPDIVQPVREALDAYYEIQDPSKADNKQLSPIIEAAHSHRRPLYELAADMLQQLTADNVEAREAVARMATDKRSHVRFNAVICLGADTPRDFSIELVRRALNDKSAKVRQKAADWAQRRGLSEVVADLEQRLAVESHAATKQTIEFILPLLRDGYRLEEDGTEGFSITVPYTQGITSRRVSREEVEAKGIESVVAAIRKEYE